MVVFKTKKILPRELECKARVGAPCCLKKHCTLSLVTGGRCLKLRAVSEHGGQVVRMVSVVW